MTDESLTESARGALSRRPRARIVYVVTVADTLVFLEGRSKWLAERGVDVTVCCAPDPRLDEFGRREGCRTVAIPITRSISPLRDVSAIRALRRVIRDVDPSIVHSMTPKAGLIGTIAGRLARGRVAIYEIYGLPHDSATGVQRQILKWSERVCGLLADRVFAVSHSMAKIARRDRLVPGRKLAMIREGSANGVDAMGEFSPDADPGARDRVRSSLGIGSGGVMVLFVGRLTRDKGVAELQEAWKVVARDIPDAHLVLAGVEDTRVPLDPAVLRRLRASPRVHLLGHVPHREVPDLMRAADLLVLPTYREGYPYALLEAASTALPIVATNVPGCTDAVVDGATGTLVPPRDPGALAAAITRYAGDAQLRARHGSAGRERVLADFQQDQIWAAVLEEYERITEGSRR